VSHTTFQNLVTTLKVNDTKLLSHDSLVQIAAHYGFDSRRPTKLAALLGVGRSTLQNWIVAGVKVNEINQIHYDSVVQVAGRACALGKPEAIQFMTMLARAGAKAYIYHEAGYAMNAVTYEIPKSYGAALQLAADQEKEIEAKNALITLKSNQIANKDKFIIASNEASIKAGEILVREFCKSIDFICVGQNKMYEWLILLIITHKKKGSNKNLLLPLWFLEVCFF